ncbi:hypothetical protein LTR85_001070 [Meristemomyces frigidus]|nr:hypothetical protein LTR85_001070 [Meristemomyces frigidus]
MSSAAVTKKPTDAMSQATQQGSLEAREQSAKANASAGLNLNLVGAVSGMFSSKSKKETEADGSSFEERSQQAGVKGAGAANVDARAAASAEQKGRQMRVQDKE